jgi:hypothetical protein
VVELVHHVPRMQVLVQRLPVGLHARARDGHLGGAARAEGARADGRAGGVSSAAGGGGAGLGRAIGDQRWRAAAHNSTIFDWLRVNIEYPEDRRVLPATMQ